MYKSLKLRYYVFTQLYKSPKLRYYVFTQLYKSLKLRYVLARCGLRNMPVDLAKVYYLQSFAVHIIYIIIVNSPTRIQYNKNTNKICSATIIDHIFSNLTEFICNSGNLAYADSDHFVNFLTVFNNRVNNKYTKRNENSPIFKRIYTIINHDLLQDDFANIDWDTKVLNNNISLNEAVLNMIKLLTDLCDKHAPLTKSPKRKINYIYKPWITKDILPYIIAKNKMAANRHKILNSLRKCEIM